LVDKTKIRKWKTPEVGDEIDSICSRCHEETIHRIVATVETSVHTVICTRCGNQHRHRPSLAARVRKVPLPTERQAKVLKKIAAAQSTGIKGPLEAWQILKENAAEEESLPYDPSLSYLESQAIEHPTFGLGFVFKVLDPTKIEVVFEHQIKILVMNRPKSGQE
jgi:hypothetical protein